MSYGASLYEEDALDPPRPQRSANASEIRRRIEALVDRAVRSRLKEAGGLHGDPTGIPRILPTVYTLLTDKWLTKEGHMLPPHIMHEAHRHNAMNLVKESHGELQARSMLVLGKIADHYQNVPEIGEICIVLAEALQQIEVDQVYPVFKTMAKVHAEAEKIKAKEQDDLFGGL